ncbi:MAG TPA: preprotein translocase subunit SecY [bacterium]|nr:preprotein translocase subunit SecY [bacterium]HNS49279.1 preprotein translocase subunit SecY [bacterium]
MANLSPFRDSLKIPDLRHKIGVTLLLLAVYRFGCYIPVPGIDGAALAQFFAQVEGTLLGVADLFTGGALSQATIFALGIMPYISVSIVLELLTTMVPALENMIKSGVEGRRRLTQLTRQLTALLCLFQGMMISLWLENPASFGGVPIVVQPGWAFRIIATITLTAGTMFLMWLGEQITEKGIGNGISLIITLGILSRYPTAVKQMLEFLRTGRLSGLTLILLAILIVLVVAATIMLIEGERRIPVQYARRMVGRRQYGGQSTYLPVKVNQGGVIPLIFAVSILLFPATILRFYKGPLAVKLAGYLNPGGWLYTILYALLAVFFCYFYAAVSFKPDNVADDLRKYGGFIAGIRPGKTTGDYLERILLYITFPGALFLVAIALFPNLVMSVFRIPYLVASLFGGVGLLIVVAVLIETMRQIEAHLVMRHYEGFLKKARIR